MKKGTNVLIKLSKDLIELKLALLSEREGVIIEEVANEKNEIKGYWVELSGEPYEDETEWFIPVGSIVLK